LEATTVINVREDLLDVVLCETGGAKLSDE
jgi:hypothetical protein